MALHDNELTIKSVCGNIHNVVPLQRCDCSLSSKIFSNSIRNCSGSVGDLI